MNALETRKLIQRLLHVSEDGVFGKRTDEAYHLLDMAQDGSEWPVAAPTNEDGVHHVKMSSFADPADIAAFKRCKAQGNSDQFCFSKGDNGIGKWGDDCSAGSGPRVALPPEDWQQWGSEARGKRILVTHGDKSVICELRDTMPHKANIKNGAGIDLNPDACAALGLNPPILVDGTWKAV